MESVNRQKQASTPRILSQFSDSVEVIKPSKRLITEFTVLHTDRWL
jgi:hypothetical protein